jgi:hypothetical protein
MTLAECSSTKGRCLESGATTEQRKPDLAGPACRVGRLVADNTFQRGTTDSKRCNLGG